MAGERAAFVVEGFVRGEPLPASTVLAVLVPAALVCVGLGLIASSTGWER
ncbi:MAG: hypothetical protein AAF602_24340 [Myxococcota bacterium]